MFRCRLALKQKKVPASLTCWHFSEVLIFFALWFSANSRTQKLNSKKVDQWRIRRRMWRNMYQYRRSFSHKVTTRRFFPQHSTLTPGAGSKTAVGRSIYIYILAGQPGVARAFALRADKLCSSFLASCSLNPEMNCSRMRKIAFL